VLKLSRKLVLAVEAVVDIALHGTAGPVASADITGRQGIPRRYLEQVLQQLVRAGILAGTRGPRGGYRLARERRRISVAAILSAVEADAAPSDLPAGGSALAAQVIAPALDEVLTACLARLEGLTVDDLCRQAQARGLHGGDDRPLDFSI
jgi:Rrf2 family protein